MCTLQFQKDHMSGPGSMGQSLYGPRTGRLSQSKPKLDLDPDAFMN